MKKTFIAKIFFGLPAFFLLATLFPSCKKDEINSRELLVFLQADKEGIPTKTQTVPFVHNPTGVTGETNVEVFAYATRDVVADVDLFVQGDPTLVDAYNMTNGTSCLALPAANYRLVNGDRYTIASGASKSGPLTIEIVDPAQLNNPEGYVLPLSIARVASADKGVAVSSTHATVYIKVTYEFNNILQTEVPLTGTLLSRTGWSVSVSNTTSGSLGPAMLDGNNSTSWRSSNSSSAAKWAVIDMGATQTIRGFQMVPSYVSANENATRITVSTSTDNNTWTVQGVWNGTRYASGSSAANPDIKGINFAAPVTARYFRYDFNAWVSGNRVGMAEVNAVQ